MKILNKSEGNGEEFINEVASISRTPHVNIVRLLGFCLETEMKLPVLARGTGGYIAPEVFSRNFGVVSHKSDVYSFGMMVLEMVGRRKNIKAEVDNSSEIYFPHWIYSRLESNK